MVKYTAPEMEVVLVETADIILASKGNTGEVVTPGVRG